MCFGIMILFLLMTGKKTQVKTVKLRLKINGQDEGRLETEIICNHIDLKRGSYK